MNPQLVSSSLNSFPLNSSQIFSTHLTLSINSALNLLNILRRVPEEIAARSSMHKKKSAPGRAFVG